MARQDYPDRSIYIQQLTALLKATQRSVGFEEAVRTWSGPTGPLLLDHAANQILIRLGYALSQNEYFEYLHKDIGTALLEFLASYAANRVGKIKALATELLDEMAREPARARLYFGIRHLRLDGSLEIGDATILGRRRKAFLAKAMPRGAYRRTDSFIRVAASGGTSSALYIRGQQKAELALAILRLHLRRGLDSVAREELLFDLSGAYVEEALEGDLHFAWRSQPTPIRVDLGNDRPEWREQLTSEAEEISRLPARVRDRVHNALQWIDRAMRSATWRTHIPDIFTAMESLLVPENCRSKAEVVTVRSVALQLSFDDWFTSPSDTCNAYLVRCALIHGEPLPENFNESCQDGTWKLEHWADKILTAYVRYGLASQYSTVGELVTQLDGSEACDEACQWLIDSGDRGSKVVADYREAVGRE